MSLYYLLPPSKTAENYSFWEKGFSQSELDRIRVLGDAKIAASPDPYGKIGLNEGNVVDDVRRSKVAWFDLCPETEWIYDKLGFICRELNGEYFQFDIGGFSENLQYTVYEGEQKGHFDWHMDMGNGGSMPPRKLALILQLSDPSEYEGGELQVLPGRTIETLKKEQGLVYAFPSYLLHRVTPVTKGTRRTLVIWLYGPRFR